MSIELETPFVRESAAAAAESTQIFKIFIAHENLTAAMRAKEVAERLVVRLGPAFAAEIDYWRLDWLAHSQLREQAAAEAVAADMIVFSSDTGGLPSAHVKTWVESWLPEKNGGWAALVLLLDTVRSGLRRTPALCRYLREVASRGNLDFFCNVEEARPHDTRQTVSAIEWQAQSRLLMKETVLSGNDGLDWQQWGRQE